MDSDKQSTHGPKDYYYILGLTPEASNAQIKAAYQDLYDKLGPHVTLKEQDADANVKAYKDICEAWEVLSNPTAKAEYDQTQIPLLQKSQLRNLWGKLTGVKADEPKHRDDLQDTRVILEITLREAVKGGRKTLRVEDSLTCDACINKKPVDRTKCLTCHGSGLIRADRNEIIDLEKGMFDKQELRYPGKGKFDTRSRKHADLIVEIKVAPHPYFSVHGKDVSCSVPVTIYEAILGAEIETPTPTGRVAVKIQPLTQRGRVYRLKGLGIGGGDLLLSIEVLIPTQLHGDEVELFRKLLQFSSQPNPRTELFAKLASLAPPPPAQQNNNTGNTGNTGNFNLP